MVGRRIRVATCQFPVTKSIEGNFEHIVEQMRCAGARKADVVHFSECALSGYMGRELRTERELDYAQLRKRTEDVMEAARGLGVWVVVGSTHRLTGHHSPHNSLYVIDERGRLLERYDKMFCTGKASPAATDDLRFYSPGGHFVTLEVKGVRCGLLICHDYRYPELYRRYKRMGVEVVFHSFHNAGARKLEKDPELRGEIVRATIQASAASNYMWVSANNSSRRYSSWGSFFVRPDGKIIARTRRHTAAVLVNQVHTGKKYYDASADWRPRVLAGVFHSGKLVRDPRSRRRNVL
ncbi:MAG: carbon-nitrogen hydrolase family protein [Planctomycetota bacterium]